MVLPSLFSKNTTQNNDAKLFLALLITDTTLQAGFWEVGIQSITIRQHSKVYTYSDVQTLLIEADNALQELGKASEDVEEVIFGLEFNWVDEKGIADAKKPLLKKLTKDLALKPVGFVVSTEALYHSLIADDPQLSTLLIQYTLEHITVSIINRGKLVSSERVGRSDDPGADIQEATARLLTNQENPVLPPKAHLVSPMVDTAELKSLKNKLAEFNWKDVNPKINHQPTVEILPLNAMLEAVIQEGGRAVADAQGYEILGALEKKVESGDTADARSLTAFGSPHSTEKAIESESGQPSFQSQHTFDNAVMVPSEIPPERPSERPFVDEFSKPTTFSENTMQKQPFLNRMMPKASFPKSGSSFKAANWMSHHLTFVFGGFGAGLVTLLVIGYISLLSAKMAVVELTLAAKTVANEVAITLDPTVPASSPEDLLLKAELIESSFSESKTIDTTGVKLVGEAAKGRVTVTNKTNNQVTISSGTQLVGGGVTFTLDEEIRIASASVSQNGDGETKTYGKTDASVTAVKIGAEGNIGSGVKMLVGTFSEDTASAETSEAFDGGSSREVRIFSDEDKIALLDAVKKRILEKAEAEFKSTGDSGTYTIPTGEITVSDATYDAKVGDEVSTVSLALEADVSAVTYLTEDVESLVGFALKDKIPSGYVLSDKQPSILSKPDDNATASGKQVVLVSNISAQALPQFNEDSFKNEISGQSPSSAEAILRGKAEVDEAVVQLKPGLAKFISNVLPKKIDKIIFTVVN